MIQIFKINGGGGHDGDNDTIVREYYGYSQ